MIGQVDEGRRGIETMVERGDAAGLCRLVDDNGSNHSPLPVHASGPFVKRPTPCPSAIGGFFFSKPNDNAERLTVDP